MKTAVSIPDDLFAQAEKVAAERNMSRSALYAEALAALLKRVRDEQITEQMNRALAESGQTQPDPVVLRAAAQMGKRLARDDPW
jgi:predicted transcriptional regulator